jgi:hypothetical protein
MLQKMFSSSDEVSEMRVMALVALLVGAGIAFYGLKLDKDLTGLAVLSGVFVGPAFAGKVGQKFVEAKAAIAKQDSPAQE